MAYNVYQDDELIGTTEDKEYTVEGLTPNTEYSFSVSEVIGDKESDKATVAVKTNPVAVTGVTVNPATLSLETEETGEVTATVTPSNATNKSVSWSTSDADVATVANGVVAGVGAGSATITATTGDGDFTGDCEVTVTDPVVNVAGVTLSPKTSTGEAGTAGTRQLTATVAPSDATNKAVTYAIAPTTSGLSVSSSGLIEWTAAVAAGTYTTTVTTTDGSFTDNHVLTLTEPEPDPEPDPEEPEE